MGIPVVLGSKSPAQITLLDVGAVLYASDDAPTVDVLDTAAIEIADTGSPPVTTMTSLWQTNSIAFAARLVCGWAPAYPNCAAWVAFTGSPA